MFPAFVSILTQRNEDTKGVYAQDCLYDVERANTLHAKTSVDQEWKPSRTFPNCLFLNQRWMSSPTWFRYAPFDRYSTDVEGIETKRSAIWTIPSNPSDRALWFHFDRLSTSDTTLPLRSRVYSTAALLKRRASHATSAG
jgi:hypothetical protein